MNTLLWLFIEYVNPAVMWFYPACDLLLGWTQNLGGIGGVVAIGVITGLGVNLFQKFCSRQKLLGSCKADLDRLKVLMSEAKAAGNDDRWMQLMRSSKRISGKYMWGSLKPAFLTVPPVIVIAMWTGSRLGYQPVRPEQVVGITACFENEARGYALLVPGDGLELAGPPLAPIVMFVENPKEQVERAAKSKHYMEHPFKLYNPLTWLNSPPAARGLEARWKVKAVRSSDGAPPHTLTVRYPVDEGRRLVEETIELPVTEKAGRPPEFINFMLFETPTMDHMQSVQFEIPETMPAAWWNLWITWMGVYIIVAVAGGVGFRFALKVN